MNKKTLLSLVIAAALTLAGCSNSHYTREGGEITTANVSEISAKQDKTVTETAEATDDIAPSGVFTITGRDGSELAIPDRIDTIISAAPSVTEILAGLGLSDRIIAADVYSADVEGISPEICTLDFYNLSAEELIVLEPDAVIINGISEGGDSDPYAALKEAGINVVYIPTSSSLESIKLDIEFLAAYTGTSDRGAELINSINMTIADISAKADSVTERKSVYFEIGAAPYLYSCGSGTFIDEILELVGADNIYGSETGYLANSEETVIAADPDVIITNVMFEGYDFSEIKNRPGWENIKAVKNGEVYQVDSNSTSRPSQFVIKGIYEIAEAVYPEIYRR